MSSVEHLPALVRKTFTIFIGFGKRSKVSLARQLKKLTPRFLKRAVNKAAGEKTPETHFLKYVEDVSSRERS